MKRTALDFNRPSELAARHPATVRGIAKDQIRLMVSSSQGHHHTRFGALTQQLAAGDVLVVNNSATLPASLPASGSVGDFVLNLSTDYGRGLWLAEPRWQLGQAGPLPFQRGDEIRVGDLKARLVAPYPALERLWFVQFAGCVRCIADEIGQPIRYDYVRDAYPLHHYQTVFATTPGSVEMPSAAYPFTQALVDRLLEKSIHIADITLHTGVSSLEVDVEEVEAHPLYPEPFVIPQKTVTTINHAKKEGRRVVAVGTTVVRALESGWAGTEVQAKSGFTRRFIHPRVGINVVDGLITGLHDPVTSHLAMLYTVASESLIKEAYQVAVQQRYLWHEFGDSHLIWRH